MTSRGCLFKLLKINETKIRNRYAVIALWSEEVIEIICTQKCYTVLTFMLQQALQALAKSTLSLSITHYLKMKNKRNQTWSSVIEQSFS